ncbi:MAG: aspartyl protease [Microcystis wesenbergii Mw_QC_B_20070930_S4]|jgi:predicted aspartyl protease|nr:MAG: aspartyl protease [Microcystis wesenbergii Mw_QC_B_20070930_S4D]TRV10623.1 MAG: aspartyl protease [Microcystis wesenbergii Mw_QC_B_20070930_S4]
MIRGTFGDNCEIFFPIDLITGESENLSVDAMLDTGFTEFLAINKQDVEGLNWAYFDQEEMLTARGLANFDIYLGNGSQWLKELDLMVRYRQEELKLQ